MDILKPHSSFTSDPNASCLPSGVSAPIMSVLEQWKTARRLLTSTIQSYLAASATLRASCITPIRRPIEKSMAKEALSMIDSELESLALEEKKLCNMRISLTVARNNSATVVLVNTLPPEVLARIFAFSRTHCYYDYDYDYEKDNFSSVCGYWRQTALNATDLWTHVDIEHTTSRNLTRLLLDRSKNAPIYVHAYEREQDQAASGGYTPEYAANEIVAILRPHLHRVSSLEIESDNERDGFVYSLLERWSNHVSINFPTSLIVRRPIYNIRSIRSWGQQVENMLLAFNILHLQNSKFGWDSNAYHGLVDLRIHVDRGKVFISLPELANILATCPTLAILKLEAEVTRAKGQVQPAPIEMRCLKVVNLFLMDSDSVNLVLSLITLPGPGAELGITVEPYQAIDSHLIGFFARSKVATLLCQSDRVLPSTHWNHFLQCLPGPSSLVLRDFRMIGTPTNRSNGQSSPLALSSQLSSVTFLSSTVDFESLECLIAQHGTRDLRLEQCKGPPNQGLPDIQALLEKRYPDLRCSISDIDSTEQLGCRKIFDDF